MFRRYRLLVCLVMACFVALLVSASPAIASPVMVPNLEPLWKAYPLHPSGERLAKTNERSFVPPTTGIVEAFIPASDRDPGGIFRPTLLTFLLAALVAPMLVWVPLLGRPKPNNDGSDRLFKFSFIGTLVAAETLGGYAIYTLAVSLLL
jgi:hypothetical protein